MSGRESRFPFDARPAKRSVFGEVFSKTLKEIDASFVQISRNNPLEKK
jgi:hypothetical protein